MTSLFPSKWLACALALLVLVLAVIRTSHALKCYWCAEGESKEECLKMVCPDDDFYRTFAFGPNSTKEVHVACYSMHSPGIDAYLCNPNGMKWAAILGGQDKCEALSDLDAAKQKEMLALLLEDNLENDNMGKKMAEAEEAEIKQLDGQQVTPEQLKLIEAMTKFRDANRGRSSSTGGEKVCVCTKDLCNSEGLKEKTTTTKTTEATMDKSGTISGFEFRNGTIIVIVLVAFACLSFIHGF